MHNTDGSWTVTELRAGSPDGIDTLWNIELLQFGDTVVTIDSYTPPPVVANAAPTMTSTASLVSLTEWADRSANEVGNTPHTTAGTITYSDADAGDIHSASFKPAGTGYLGTFALNTGSIDSADSVGWSFTVSDSAIDYLKAGQTLTQTYDVAIDDGHGGTAMQTVTITLMGADDAVTKSAKAGGKGRGNDNEFEKASDVLLLLEMQHDQAAAPAASWISTLDLYSSPDGLNHAPEIKLAGLAHLFHNDMIFH